MCSAIRRRTPRSGSRRPSSGSAPPAAARTSSSVIRPPGPLPASDARSTPSSCATRRTSGVARTFARGLTRRGRLLRQAPLPRAAAPPRPAPAPSSPITTSTVPTGTTSPSATRILATFPAAGDGISTVVLSVCTSTSGSSSAISCPSDTSQRAISPSVSPSPRSGSLNSYAISRSVWPRRAARRGRRARGSRAA